MQRLFSLPKIGLFVDGYGPATEKRRGDETTIVKMQLRLQPFDAKLAASIDDGLSDNSGVRTALFKLNNPEPKPHIDRLDFNLSCPRQNIEIFASPDTDESRILFPQVKIGKVYARTQKDIDGFALVIAASFGPVDKNTLEFLHGYYGKQFFCSFTEAEPSLEFSDEVDEDDASESDEDDQPLPAIFEDEDESPNVTAAKKATSERKRDKGHHYARRHADPQKKAKKAAKRGKR